MLALVVATLVAYALTFDLGQQQPYGMPDGAGASACGLTPLTPPVHTLCSFPVSFKQACGATEHVWLLTGGLASKAAYPFVHLSVCLSFFLL